MNKRGRFVVKSIAVCAIIVLVILIFQTKFSLTLSSSNTGLISDNSITPKVGGGGGMKLPGQPISPPFIREEIQIKNITQEVQRNQSEKVQVPQINITRYIDPTIKENLKNQSWVSVSIILSDNSNIAEVIYNGIAYGADIYAVKVQ